MKPTKKDELLIDHNHDGRGPPRLSEVHGLGGHRHLLCDERRRPEILQPQPSFGTGSAPPPKANCNLCRSATATWDSTSPPIRMSLER